MGVLVQKFSRISRCEQQSVRTCTQVAHHEAVLVHDTLAMAYAEQMLVDEPMTGITGASIRRKGKRERTPLLQASNPFFIFRLLLETLVREGSAVQV